jgi:hypothetical protein
MAKVLKVELTVQEEDGRVVVKTLEGEDAERWDRFIASVCVLAHVHRANPDWSSLRWRKKEASIR